MHLSRRKAIAAAAAIATAGALVFWRRFAGFPPDTTPEGVYDRIGFAMNQGDVRAIFAYLEDDAQHACFTLRSYRKKASDRIAATYPEPERTRLLEAYAVEANAPDGPDVWLEVAERRGFIARLRRDLSGPAKVEIAGDRATIETTRGTRYAMRRRENGIWGLSLFTAELVAEAERASRDAQVVEQAADDYAHARK